MEHVVFELPDICLQCGNLKPSKVTIGNCFEAHTCENALCCKKIDDAIIAEEEKNAEDRKR